MRNEEEILQLKDELIKLTDFIEDNGTVGETESEDVCFASDVLDVIDWVLDEISHKDFQKSPYLNMNGLRKICKEIEKRTGEKLDEE